MGFYSHSNGGAIQRDRSSSFQEYQCFESWNSEKKNSRDTIHFNADAPNTELLFRIVLSVNQLSICGAGSNRCDQFGLTEEEKEQERHRGSEESVTKGVLSSANSQGVKLLVCFPRLASGNSLRRNIQDFESLPKTIRFPRVCEDAIFAHRVASGMSYKTRLDEDDGLGQLIPLCREYTFSQVNSQSRAFAAIPG